MDGEFMFAIGFLTLIVIGLVVVVPLAIWDQGIRAPQAAEDALQQCQKRGFTTYSEYERKLFSTEALGVKCERPFKNYNIEGNGMLIIPAT